MFAVFLLFYFLYLIKSNNLNIDFKSFIKKGFPKNDNDFGLYCYTGKQRKR